MCKLNDALSLADLAWQHNFEERTCNGHYQCVCGKDSMLFMSSVYQLGTVNLSCLRWSLGAMCYVHLQKTPHFLPVECLWGGLAC